MSTRILAPGVDYLLTEADENWAFRAAVAEAGTPPADASNVLWCYAQRLVMFRLRGREVTLMSVIREHSQPVNPRWRRDGEFCRAGGKFAGTDHCSESRLKRRDFFQTGSLEAALKIRPVGAVRAQAWMRGALRNDVPRSTNFADETVTKNYLVQHPAATLLRGAKGDNWFIVEGDAAKWPADFVSVLGDNTTRMSLVASTVDGFLRTLNLT